jgi:hypothetical protein
MSKYTLNIGSTHAGQFSTLKECREHAKNNGGYRHGWTVWDNRRQCEVLNKGESAIHLTDRVHNGSYDRTARVHDDFYDRMGKKARTMMWFIYLVLVIAVLASQ